MNIRILSRWLPWLLVILVLTGIYCASTQAFSSNSTELFFGQYNNIVRKAAHFAEYAVLFFALNWALNFGMRGRWRLQTALFTFFGCVIYAMSDEWHQSFVPGRGPSLHDVLIDAAGALFAFLCWLAYTRLSARVK
jgi:VanZ family protein